MSLIDQMGTWKRVAFINVFGIVGIVASIFALPENTPFWIWAICSLAVLIILNLVAMRKSPQESSGSGQKVSKGTLVIVGGALLLIIDLAWTYWSRR
jgi:hypothetical protein